jgi:hypothetical protein
MEYPSAVKNNQIMLLAGKWIEHHLKQSKSDSKVKD